MRVVHQRMVRRAQAKCEETCHRCEGEHEAVCPWRLGEDPANVNLQCWQREGEDQRGEQVSVDVDGFVVKVGEGVNTGVIAVRDRAVCRENVGVILIPFWKVGECHQTGCVLGLGVTVVGIIAILGGSFLSLRRWP